MTDRVFNVLVLCTGNSARSILGEALFNHLGNGRIRAFSAGSQPAGKVNPVALETLEKHGVPLPEARSKSWDEFAQPGAPELDFIFTVCASAAGEACPIWPGHPATAHWGIADPAHVEPLEARRDAFETAYGQLERRIRAFLALPLETLTGADLKAAARKIHEEADIMKKLEVFDPAMCCSTGVCGVDVDPVLVQFNADLQWLASQGVGVARYNLAQEPQAFAANPAVVKEMEAGLERLPIIAVDGHIITTGLYPSRAQLAAKLGIAASPAEVPVKKTCCNPKTGCC